MTLSVSLRELVLSGAPANLVHLISPSAPQSHPHPGDYLWQTQSRLHYVNAVKRLYYGNAGDISDLNKREKNCNLNSLFGRLNQSKTLANSNKSNGGCGGVGACWAGTKIGVELTAGTQCPVNSRYKRDWFHREKAGGYCTGWMMMMTMVVGAEWEDSARF